MKNAAINQGRYFTTGEAAIASTSSLGANHPDGVFTFVDGDLTLGPGDPTGQGTLIVTGKLTLSGNFNFNGVIMVLGSGEVYRSGGGHGNIYGALFVAKFATAGADTDILGANLRHVRWWYIEYPVQLRCDGPGEISRWTFDPRCSRVLEFNANSRIFKARLEVGGL